MLSLVVFINLSHLNRVTESECDGINACLEFLRRVLLQANKASSFHSFPVESKIDSPPYFPPPLHERLPLSTSTHTHHLFAFLVPLFVIDLVPVLCLLFPRIAF